MKISLRNKARIRAGRRCEYCRFSEVDLPYHSFHLEHIIARKHGGTDEDENRCWSCQHCNLAKSSNLSGRDPTTGNVVELFHPRRQQWQRHFRFNGPYIEGRTQCGRATLAVLNINAPHRIELRADLIAVGKWPPR
ncbi:MAG TPA: HNH endonuclease signature motif containing protein [Gemmataceae bacterium]|nr:HNH endonuclease signature motif containing protein [Gemmataceae bacterium]